MGMFDINAIEVPAIRIAKAIGDKVDKNLLFVVGGGLGDQATAEPTVRYAVNNFKDCNVSVFTQYPTLYSHLNVPIYTYKDPLNPKEFLQVFTYPMGLSNQFVNANLLHCIDFPSISALRMQLIGDDRMMKFSRRPNGAGPDYSNHVVMHLGKTWESRTLPSEWWSKMIKLVRSHGMRVVLIGNDCVDADALDSIDLRGETTTEQFISCCLSASMLITNDSSPLHLAAAGSARIAFVPTCRPPELLTHERLGGHGWKMKAFTGKNKMWELFPKTPNTLDPRNLSKVPQRYKIDDFIPEQEEILDWLTMLKEERA